MAAMGHEGNEGGKAFDAAADCATLQSDSTPHASPGNGEADQAGSFCLSGKPALAGGSEHARINIDSTPHASPGNGEADQAGSFSVPLKKPKTFIELADHLRKKGLSIADEDLDFVVSCLCDFGYYRLRGYWMNLEKDSRFLSGTTFSDVWNIAKFDSEIRAWLLQAIEPVEVKLRTQLAYHLAHRYGPDALDREEAFADSRRYRQSMSTVKREAERARRDGVPYVCHNLQKYGRLPIWAAVEIMSFGTTSKLFGNLKDPSLAKLIAESFNVKARYLKSWVELLTYVRNLAAHDNRFYHRVMKKRPALYQEDRPYEGEKEFPTFLVLRQLHLRSWPQAWPERFARLCEIVDRYPSVDLVPMGFPKNWRTVLGAGLAEGGTDRAKELA